eukprot:CAMPEP_0168470474 /NCGR_PEP_ID=MMETSP0228-20121227/58747_1 /TAXON_ID=133427 /ORGANISM="Protoceratium reticulatum, Strain CCCM 535 (=CCMP 1889)" /LENGTH=117 /DNA_ID=CAMNT_0008486277 /DNA_START=629 /DNA_END=982 /DNA_ORIENTATION=-
MSSQFCAFSCLLVKSPAAAAPRRSAASFNPNITMGPLTRMVITTSRPHPSCSPLARTPPMFDAELDTGWWQRAFVPSMHLQGAPSLKCATEAECRPLPQTCGERAELRTLILEVGNL